MEEQVVVVTGAGGGLGRGLAHRFGRLGATVVCLDVDLGKARESAALAEQAGGDGLALACDVSVTGQVEAAVKDLQRDMTEALKLVGA